MRADNPLFFHLASLFLALSSGALALGAFQLIGLVGDLAPIDAVFPWQRWP
ncbi:MAG: hypothetical protein MZV65_30150 [Chromatiales bacterium]|nr:hypothetical protein [Chromatiales bacterium]